MIRRRDFLNGVALPVAAPGLVRGATAEEAADPALRTGLQGQTDELAAPAHRLREAAKDWRDGVAERDDGVEDLVVVGAGLSGLAGTHLFVRHAGRPVRVLLLDALDDFGGHARRNEFVSRSGRRLVGYGGSQSLDSPGLFSPAARGLLGDLGLELKRFETEFFDHGWAKRHGVEGRAWLFDPRHWPAAAVVRRGKSEPAEAWAARLPIGPAARADLARLLSGRPAPLRELPPERRREALSALTYRQFLRRHWRVAEDVVRLYAQDTLGYFGVGADAVSALDAFAAGLPGFDGLDLGPDADRRMSPSGRLSAASRDEYVYHFPDGNAGVARALLRALIPAALPGEGMDSLADAPVRRDELDRPGAALRLRLRSTVVGLRHLGPPASAEAVALRYVDAAGRLREVRARQVLLACWHRVIARLTDELPPAQRQALELQVKTPLVYASVLLGNWRAWQRAGIRSIKPVDGFWQGAALDFPVSMGGVRFAASPDEPILVHLDKVCAAGGARPPREQAALGRAALAQWPFARFEDEIRRLLDGALGPHGFDAARDIEAVTVNRWSHGYADEYLRPWDRFWPGGPLPCHAARRGWGRVAIANSDAGAYAYAHSAIDQATRAVQELLPQATLPRWHDVPGPDPRAIGLAPG